MADKNKIKEIQYVNENITKGLAYFQTQNMSGKSKVVLVAEIIDNKTIELGLLGAYKENPLILDSVIKKLQSMVASRSDSLVDVEVLELTD